MRHWTFMPRLHRLFDAVLAVCCKNCC